MGLRFFEKVLVGVFIFLNLANPVAAIRKGYLPGQNCGGWETVKTDDEFELTIYQTDADGNYFRNAADELIPKYKICETNSDLCEKNSDGATVPKSTTPPDQSVCFKEPDPHEVDQSLIHDKTPRGVLLSFINYAISFSGLLAVVAIIYSAFLWITAMGNDGQYEKGKKYTLYSLGGLILILFSYTLVQLVVSFGQETEIPPTPDFKVEISPKTGKVNSGENFQFSASFKQISDEEIDGTPEISWTVSPEIGISCDPIKKSNSETLNLICQNSKMAIGAAQIRAELKVKIGKYEKYFSQKATLEIAPGKVLISPMRAAVFAGESFEFSAKISGTPRWSFDADSNLNCESSGADSETFQISCDFVCTDSQQQKDENGQIKTICRSETDAFVVVNLQIDGTNYSDKATLRIMPDPDSDGGAEARARELNKKLYISPLGATTFSGETFVFTRNGASGAGNWKINSPIGLNCKFSPENGKTDSAGDKLQISCNFVCQNSIEQNGEEICLDWGASPATIGISLAAAGETDSVELKVFPPNYDDQNSLGSPRDLNAGIYLTPISGTTFSEEAFIFTRRGKAGAGDWKVDAPADLNCKFSPENGKTDSAGDKLQISCKNETGGTAIARISLSVGEETISTNLKVLSPNYDDQNSLGSPRDLNAGIYLTPISGTTFSEEAFIFTRRGKAGAGDWKVDAPADLNCKFSPENGKTDSAGDKLQISCKNETGGTAIARISLSVGNDTDSVQLFVRQFSIAELEKSVRNYAGGNFDSIFDEKNGDLPGSSKTDDEKDKLKNGDENGGSNLPGSDDLKLNNQKSGDPNFSTEKSFPVTGQKSGNLDLITEKDLKSLPEEFLDLADILRNLKNEVSNLPEGEDIPTELLSAAIDKIAARLPAGPAARVAALKNDFAGRDSISPSEAAREISNLIEIINSIPKVKAIATARPNFGVAPLEVLFNGLESIDPAGKTIPTENFSWSLIDSAGELQNLPSGPAISHIFEIPGIYVVNLQVESIDPEIAPGSTNLKITVNPPETAVDFLVNTEKVPGVFTISRAEAENGVLFDPSSTTISLGRTIREWRWDFADGTIETFTQQESTVHPFLNAGDFRVSLTVVDNLGETKSKQITVRVAETVAKISLSPETEGTLADKFIFNGEKSRASNGSIKNYFFKITGPENFESEEKKFAREFKTVGDYTVQLTVEDDRGNRATDVKNFSVRSQKPNAIFTFKIPKTSQPSKVKFDAGGSSDPDGDQIFYSWDFDADGVFEIEKSPDSVAFYEFDREQTFRTILKVTDEFGEFDENEKKVKIDSIFSVDFRTDRAVARVGQEIIFNAIAPDAVGFLWNFGNGVTAAGENSTQKNIFQKDGRQMVRLTAFDKFDRENSVEKWVYIGEKDAPVSAVRFTRNSVALEPVADLCGAEKNGLEIYRADLIEMDASESENRDGSNSNLEFQWKFGDGSFSTQSLTRKQFSEIPPGDGCESVELIISDEKTGRSDSQKIYFKIKNAAPVFDKFEIRAPKRKRETPFAVPVSLLGAHDPDGRIVQFKWWVQRDGSDEKVDLHTTSSPQTSLTILPRGLSGQINRWRFFAEMKDSNGTTTKNTDLFGESIFLDVKNNKNLAPVVDFRVDKTTVKMGDTVTFVATARDPQGDEISDSAFKWDFDGDNVFDEIGTGPTISRRFEIPGEYPVRLKVENRGLATSVVRKIFVERTSKLPFAAFTFKTAGTKVIFNASNSKADPSVPNNELQFEWDFDTKTDADGDGISDNDFQSTNQILEFDFQKEGTYSVKLTIRDKINSTDFVVRKVEVVPPGEIASTDPRIPAEKTLTVKSKNLITTLNLATQAKVVSHDSTIDIFAFVKNADGSDFNGEIEFEILEGPAEILPTKVDAIAGEAAATVSFFDTGKILIRATAIGTVSGNLSETIEIYSQ